MNLFDVAESTAPQAQKEAEESSSVKTPKGVPPIEDLPDYEGVTKGFSPTDEQRSVLGHVEEGSGHGLVEAVAGSGKTNVLMASARLVSHGGRKCLICALNKSVEQELKRRKERESTTVATIHAMGLRALKDGQDEDVSEPDNRKMMKILKPMTSGTDLEGKSSDLAEICKLIKCTNTDPEATGKIRQITEKYGEGWNERYSDILPRAIRRSLEQTRKEGRIDHADMLYVPLVRDLFEHRYDWVLVDEAQDLNRAQQQATIEMRKPDGRSLYVGDRNQAIYGFQGAHPDSMDHITDRLDATEMKLTISFRCPRRHIGRAQEIVPDIRPSTQADEGTIEIHDPSAIPEVVQPGDMVLCRFNNQLAKWCLKTVEHGTPAYMKGEGRKQDLGSKVQQTVQNAVQDVDGEGALGTLEMQEIRDDLGSYRSRAGQLAEEKERLEKDEIQRRADAALAISQEIEGPESPHESAAEMLLEKIEAAFKDPTEREEDGEDDPSEESDAAEGGDREAVEFSTIHKAKGREASRVGIIKPDLNARRDSQPEWLNDQEENLRYVMLTRSDDTLILFREDGDRVEEPDVKVEEGEYLKVQEEAIRSGDQLEHKDHGIGTVVTVNRAEEGKMIMRFGGDTGHREVSLNRKAFKRA